MNCFYHSEKAAVGICKSCGRGLCMDCAADIQNGLACKDRCEERAARINKIIDRNPQMIAAANTQVLTQKIVLLLLGLVIMGLGVFVGFDRTIYGVPLILLGVVFLVRGILIARYPAPDKNGK